MENMRDPYQVEGQAIIGEDDNKEYQVHEEVKHISDKLQIEDIHSLHGHSKLDWKGKI